ncbi:NLP/P60 protein [Polymorphum gilvum SL003B-26A1]|uniref:NLP/P60 protein n=1 Tax=Polymorphum gilvum (strain LMG 25793 / CGMCC 1.9160 / SL003B-26A1) TaxID=991905 RepID=F2J480_POLGS|nr:NLP/P60 protein [Polymorphum gilvum SL003B-26A1]
MRRLFNVLSLWCGLVCVLAGHAAPAWGLSLDDKLALLVAAYPQSLSHVADGRLHFRDGGPPLAIDDGRTKTHAQALESADVEDMLSQPYPIGPCETRSEVDIDPGRVRSEALLKRLYGASREAVIRQLTTIDWFGARLKVTTAQGMDRALLKVRDDLAKLPETVMQPASKSAGTFNWRVIAGTDRLSVHSFGAAIDLDTAYADYWLWAGGRPGDVPYYKNRVPMEIVEVFERHGFIWGGRWYHFDTMHFEYRPELIAIARTAGFDACAAP